MPSVPVTRRGIWVGMSTLTVPSPFSVKLSAPMVRVIAPSSSGRSMDRTTSLTVRVLPAIASVPVTV